MSQKRKGFTLIEVLVVMLVATLVLSMVGGTMVFVTTTTGNLIHQSEEIELAKNIEKYLRAKQFTISSNGEIEAKIELKENSHDLFDGDELIFADTGLVEFSIDDKNDGFIRCHMKFESGRHFDFIVGNVQ